MAGRWDLGLPGAAAMAMFIFVHVISLVVRRRWRLAQVRREEVEQLVQLAAHETARAEMEAARAHVPAWTAKVEARGGGLFECAVCRRSTSTRCSRCRAVRYCSGTCQIVHWRRGHKYECYRCQGDVQDTDQESNSCFIVSQDGKSMLFDNPVGNHQKSHTKPVASCFEGPSFDSELTTYVLRDDDIQETRSFFDSSASQSGFGSSYSSSSFSGYPGYLEKCDEASAHEALHTSHHTKAVEAVPYDVSSDQTENTAEDSIIEAPPDSLISTTLSANTLSCSVNSKKKLSYSAEHIKSRLNGSLDSSIVCTNLDTTAEISQGPGEYKNRCIGSDVYSTDIPSKHAVENGCFVASSTYENSFVDACNEGTMQSNPRNFRGSGPNKLDFTASRNSVDAWSLKAKRLKSFSFSLADRAFFPGRRHSVSNNSFSKVDHAPAVSSKLSVKLNPSKSSRGSVSMPTSDLSQNYRMIFPFDLFVMLYNSTKVDMYPFGLLNCDNSCFANAVLQCLAFTRPLAAYLLQGFHSRACSRREWCFTCEFEKLILKGKQGQSPISPIGILSHIDKIGSHLSHGREEDAHEFLRQAIDAMQHACVKEAGGVAGEFSDDTSLIQLTFGGYLRSKIKCMRCRAKSEQLEQMMDLTVEIHGDIRTLEEALTHFTSSEVLDGENRYHCYRCKSYERAKKKLSVVEAPNVLTIALKRFQLGKFGKLNKPVGFPFHLDLAPFMSRADPSPLYNLYAVVVHEDVMNAAFSGHYICYVKSLKGKWYMINDKEVRPVELDRVLRENAYMLFYARISPQAPNLIKNNATQIPVKALSKCKEAPSSVYSCKGPPLVDDPSSMVHGGIPHHLYKTITDPTSCQPHSLFSERLYIPRTDSFSDNLSFSCSDEGSWSTESTRNSTSTEEFSGYLFGGADQSRWSQPFHLSEDSDYITYSPSTSSYHLQHEASGEGIEGRSNHSFCHSFLYDDRTNHSILLTDYCRGRQTDWNSPYELSSRLWRSYRERRNQNLY